MGLFDYPTIVKNPMDLGTVKKNITSRKYESIPDAAGKFLQLYNFIWTEYWIKRIICQSLFFFVFVWIFIEELKVLTFACLVCWVLFYGVQYVWILLLVILP